MVQLPPWWYQPKVVVVLNLSVTQADDMVSSADSSLLQQDGFEGGVQHLCHVLKHKPTQPHSSQHRKNIIFYHIQQVFVAGLRQAPANLMNCCTTYNRYLEKDWLPNTDGSLHGAHVVGI